MRERRDEKTTACRTQALFKKKKSQPNHSHIAAASTQPASGWRTSIDEAEPSLHGKMLTTRATALLPTGTTAGGLRRVAQTTGRCLPCPTRLRPRSIHRTHATRRGASRPSRDTSRTPGAGPPNPQRRTATRLSPRGAIRPSSHPKIPASLRTGDPLTTGGLLTTAAPTTTDGSMTTAASTMTVASTMTRGRTTTSGSTAIAGATPTRTTMASRGHRDGAAAAAMAPTTIAMDQAPIPTAWALRPRRQLLPSNPHQGREPRSPAGIAESAR